MSAFFLSFGFRECSKLPRRVRLCISFGKLMMMMMTLSLETTDSARAVRWGRWDCPQRRMRRPPDSWTYNLPEGRFDSAWTCRDKRSSRFLEWTVVALLHFHGSECPTKTSGGGWMTNEEWYCCWFGGTLTPMCVWEGRQLEFL
jgi:hypothetical protein